MKIKQEMEDGSGIKQLKKTIASLKDYLELTSAITNKYRSVLNHFEQENEALDNEDQYNFELIFREFREVLEALFHGQQDEKMRDLFTFIQELIDSIEAYMDRKKELEKVGRLEAEDIISKLQSAGKESMDTMSSIERTLRDVESSFSSISNSKFEPARESNYKRDYSPTPTSHMQGLFNLKKHLNSPREASFEDNLTQSRSNLGFSKDLKKENADIRLTNESLMQQIEVYKAELADRDSTTL